MKAYLKALILFPFIVQVSATALLYFLDADLNALPFRNYFIGAFFFATVPAFLIVLFAAKFRYVRHNITSVVLATSLISICYCNLASYFYLLVANENEPTFWQWISEGGLALGLLGVCGMLFYALFVMPWLLPKDRS